MFKKMLIESLKMQCETIVKQTTHYYETFVMMKKQWDTICDSREQARIISRVLENRGENILLQELLIFSDNLAETMKKVCDITISVNELYKEQCSNKLFHLKHNNVSRETHEGVQGEK